MDTFLRDLRFAVRALRKSPGFSATAILILAVAIGASTAMFSVFDALVLRPLPYRDPGQLVTITENFTRFEIAGMSGACGVALASILLKLFELYVPSGLVPVAGVGVNGWSHSRSEFRPSRAFSLA